MSFDPETTRIVRSWLDAGVTELPDRVLDAVLDELPATPQRRATTWPMRRLSTMSTTLKIGLAAVVVAVAAFVGINYLGTGGVGGPMPDGSPASSEAPSIEPTPEVSPSTSARVEEPDGPYVMTNSDDPVHVTVQIADPGWLPIRDFDGITKDDDGLDAPDTVGAALLAWTWPAGTAFDVYGDPCEWATTIPETPVSTPDEIAAGLAAQGPGAVTAPADVTIGGYDGVTVTLQVPMSYEVPGATREEEFAACDDSFYGYYGVAGGSQPERYAQGPAEFDELWILDVEGSIVILNAIYSPATPDELVEQMRAMVESATFEVP